VGEENMSKNKRISYLEIWWYELADDLRAERRNKLEKVNYAILNNAIITEEVDSFGKKLKPNISAADYYHATIDKDGNVIEGDFHKEVIARYSAKFFNRYFSLIMGTFGSILGIIGGILGILAFVFIKS
jgi:hypothetical protein